MLRISLICVLIALNVATAAQWVPGGYFNTEFSNQMLPLELQSQMIAADLNLQQNNISSERVDDSPIFYVRTRANRDPGTRLVVGDAVSLFQSGFNPSNPTRIIMHGYWGGSNSRVNRLVGAAYLQKGEYNIIVVDWSRIARTLVYSAAKRGIDVVAPKVAELVEFLRTLVGTDPDKIYLIGEGLGAHLAGAVGRRIITGKIGVIVAIDPSLVLYIFDLENRVSLSDAEHVLSIQTNGGQIGIFEPLGHASFYPNWGGTQPGCGIDLLGVCSHYKGIDYFAESLAGSQSQYVGRKCNSFTEILTRNCPGVGDPAFLGGDLINRSYRGVFYVPI